MKKTLFYIFIISLSSLMFFSACSHYKTGNKHVKITLQLTASQNTSEASGIIKKRLTAYGVPEKNISFVVKDNMIDIEVAHADNGERIVYLATTIGKLEFWETFENKEVYNFLNDANKNLRELFNSSDSLYIIGNDTLNKPLKKGKVPGSVKKEDVKQLYAGVVKDEMKNEIKEQKVSFEEFKKENPLFCYIQPNVVQRGGIQQLGTGAIVGNAKVKDTVTVDYILHLCFQKKYFPRDLKLLWMVKPSGKEDPVLDLVAIKISDRDEKAVLDGSVITEAHHDFSQNGTNEISMSMNAEGAKLWKRITARNIDRSIAMVVDNYVYTCPKVMSQIPNGRSSITGNFTKEEAEDLANLLNLHSLPAFKVIKVTITDEPK